MKYESARTTVLTYWQFGTHGAVETPWRKTWVTSMMSAYWVKLSSVIIVLQSAVFAHYVSQTTNWTVSFWYDNVSWTQPAMWRKSRNATSFERTHNMLRIGSRVWQSPWRHLVKSPPSTKQPQDKFFRTIWLRCAALLVRTEINMATNSWFPTANILCV